MSERKDRGALPSQQEMLDDLYEVVAAPITYARELRDRVSKPGGLLRNIRGFTVASLPIILPIALGLSAVLRDRSIPEAALTTIVAWVVAGVVVNTLHKEGIIGSNR